MNLIQWIKAIFRRQKQLRFYRSFISPNQLCFDIGANEGNRTALFLQLGARVIAIEPSLPHIEKLTQRFLNTPMLTLVQAGVGSELGEQVFYICNEYADCSTFSTEFMNTYGPYSKLSWQTQQITKMVTIEALCETYGVPHFCKIDVEGYEYEVLKGARRMPQYLAFEFNRLLLHQSQDCLLLLQQYKNPVCNYIIYEHPHFVLPQWIPLALFITQLLELIPEKILTGEIFVRFES